MVVVKMKVPHRWLVLLECQNLITSTNVVCLLVKHGTFDADCVLKLFVNKFCNVLCSENSGIK